MRTSLQAVLACLVAISRVASAADGSVDPIAAFARHDEIVDARLSPGGTTLALVMLEGGHRTLGLVDLASRKLARYRLSGYSSVGSIHWASDDRIVAELVEEGGERAAPQRLGELYAVSAGGKGGRLVFGYRAGEMQTGSHLRKAGADRAWASVLSRLRRDAHHVLIETTAWDEVGDRVVSVWRLDAVTGVKELVSRSPMMGARFLTDEEGQLRIAWAYDEAVRPNFFLREAGAGWTELADLKGVTAASEPVGFSARDRTLYVQEQDDAGFSVVAVSIPSGEREVLARNGVVPPSQLVFDADHRLVAVEFTPDLPEYTFVLPDHPVARALRGLADTYPDEHVRLVDRTDDLAKLLVCVFSDRDPGRYLVVDTAAMAADPVAQVRPWVKPEEMAEVSAFHIRASDGFRLHGYVTLPPRAGAGAPPLVVIPHGGPHWVHDTWGYDAEAQLLASQGFAVLQVNYRGSGGYGRIYQEAGYGHWGDRMIEDLLDATRFAVRKGWADPQRVCTYGASFGGYAALQAAILAPDLYRCAAGFAGVYDLETLPDAHRWIDSQLTRAYFKKAVGEDPAALRRASPAYNAERLTAAVLLIHGEKDERAPLEQADRMRKALVAVGRPPEWLVEPREGHGFYGDEARTRMYTRLLSFLRAHTVSTLAPAATP